MNLFPTDKEIIRRGRHFIEWPVASGQWPEINQQRIFARPVHRLDALGKWVAMDNQILAPWKFQVDGKALDFSLGKLQAKSEGGAVRDLAVASAECRVLAYSAEVGSATKAGSAESTVCEPYPGVQIVYQVGMAGVKEAIRISSLPALPGGAFKAKWITISGQCSVASGQWEGLTRKPATFLDAEGNAGHGHLVWDGDKFELGVDVAWLYAAPLPVVIDPTITTEGNDCTLYTVGGIAWQARHFKLPTKFIVSSIPSGANITAATLNLYCTQKGTQNVTFASKRFQSQTWVETGTYATLNAIGMGASLGSYTTGGLTLNAFNAFNVRFGANTDGIELDVSTPNTYFSPILHWNDTAPLPTGGVENLNPNNFSYRGTVGEVWTTFTSAEGASNLPYLDVTYTGGEAAKHFAVLV